VTTEKSAQPFFTVRLGADALHRIDALVSELMSAFSSVETDQFQRAAVIAAHELPRGLRTALSEFKLDEPAPGCLIQGFDVNDGVIGLTPRDWRDMPPNSPALREEIFFYLCGQLLGEPVAWATQQSGRVMHDIFPIRGCEDEQIGAGSQTTLTWHTEEAFHPLRGDYIGLMCLRNVDGIETTYADASQLKLAPCDSAVLHEELFSIKPDPSHLTRTALPRDKDAPPELIDSSYRWMLDRNENPPPAAVLFGGMDHPYLRADPAFMTAPETPQAADALRALIEQIDAQLAGIALRPGEILFLDNFRAVHGRGSFRARYDGTDRWLKRLNIVRDLRKSRKHRISAGDRVIY
jgi:Fe(II)/alpha-ketoglutarate-dependent arginine beta-hydroxylase